MIPLTVVILTKNEQKNIKDCLQSVYKWADEIIIVDDESADSTRDIASFYANKVLVKKMDIEGAHRNWAYQQAKNNWVLSLDADERVTEELKSEIADTLNNPNSKVAFAIPRRNFIADYWVKYGGWYPSAQLKLFRKDRFKWEESHVHPVAFTDGEAGRLESDLIHYSYKDISDFLNKQNRQTTLEVEKWIAQGKRIKVGKFLWRSIDRFFRSYIKKKGFRDGFYGFVVAYFASLYQFLSLLKYREHVHKS
ncbi:MAG: glycosyltransferase family 2 protein [Candidatus Saelkia tenebricola]|nr:glycosyltransferase family 2 protein [Candidatus Saelkia tenebricola]